MRRGSLKRNQAANVDVPSNRHLSRRHHLLIHPATNPVPKKILDARWTAHKTGKVKRITLPELERRLARS
ncbi:MAG: hypothetical protein JWQ83_1939 [Lacunisphaera sp.]|nr:hypothetical protein [Lacunisphaera sp.]